MAGLSRRSFLQATAGGLAGLALLSGGASPAWAAPPMVRAAGATPADDFAIVRLRWFTLITGVPFDPASPGVAEGVATLSRNGDTQYAAIDRSPTRTQLFSSAPLGTSSANLRSSFNRVRDIAFAWVTPGTTLYQDPDALAVVLDAYRFLVNGWYTTDLPPRGYDNWWDWQIGIPNALEYTMLMLGDAMPAEDRALYCSRIDHFVPSSSTLDVGTGANLLDWSRIFVINGALSEREDVLLKGVRALPPSYQLSRTGDGMFADGSFFQHTAHTPYILGYGLTFYSTIASMTYAVGGTRWQLSDPAIANVFRALDQGVLPSIWESMPLDSQEGRNVSRPTRQSHGIGVAAANMMLMYAAGAPDAATAARWRGAAKGWLSRTPGAISGSLDLIARCRAALADPTIPAADEPLTSTLWNEGERVIHRRPGWSYAVASCSARVARYELINNENLHGWHQGDGFVSLQVSNDRTQFEDAFWVTVDPHRLPGITADTAPLADGAAGNTRPTTLFSGGAWLPAAGAAGECSVFGQDLQGPESNLVAKKSWFLLDEGVVALGAGITATTSATVETIVENRNLHAGDAELQTGTATLRINGARAVAAAGESTTVRPRWIHLEGTGGYAFLGDPPTVNVAKVSRTGNWMEINPYSKVDKTETRTYATVAIQHGSAPSGASYAYATLPTASAGTTAAWAQSPPVAVLANTAKVQAVRHATSGIVAANFFAAASLDAVSASGPCAVIARRQAGVVTVSVSDPTRTQRVVTVTLGRAEFGLLQAPAGDPAVTLVSSTDAGTVLAVEVGGAHGASRTVTLSKATAPVTGAKVAERPAATDTYVRGGASSAVSYGSDPVVEVKNNTGADASFSRRGLVDFDTSGVAGTVRRAILWVHGKVNDSGGLQAQLQAFTSATGWTGSVTWDTAPALGAPLGSGWLTVDSDWVGLDVTAAFAGGAGARTSFALWQPSDGTHLLLKLDASEAGSANAPVLQLVTG